MQFTFEEFDFCGENAARTASVMRAIADAVSPQPIVCDPERATPDQLAALAASIKQVAPTVVYPFQAPPSGTVATHVSAATVGDVPFAPPPFAGFDPKFHPGSNPECPQEYPEQTSPNEPPTPAPGGVDAEGYPWDERIHASSRATVADGTWRKKRGVDDALVAEVRAEWDAKLRASVPAPAPEVVRYWHHPESSCVYKTEPGEPIGTDGLVEEIDQAQYLALEKEYARARVPAPPTEAERLQADHVSTMPAEVAPPPPPAAIDPASVGFGAAPAPAAEAWPDDILGPRTDAAAPFPQFMAYVGKRIGSGELDNVRLLAVLNEHGVPLLPALSAPEHVGKIPAIARQLAEV